MAPGTGTPLPRDATDRDTSEHHHLQRRHQWPGTGRASILLDFAALMMKNMQNFPGDPWKSATWGIKDMFFWGGRCSLSKCQIQAMKGFEAADFNWDLKCAECICKKDRQELGFHQQEGNSYQEAARWSLIHKYTRWGGMFYHHECNGITRKKIWIQRSKHWI